MTKNKKLESLINIGPRTAGILRQVNINTPEELFARDPYELIKEIMKFTSPLHCKFILASITGAHIDAPWHMIMKKTTAEFEKRYPNTKWTN